MFSKAFRVKDKLHSPFHKPRERVAEEVERRRERVVKHRRFLRTRVRIRRLERRVMANPAAALVYRTIREMSEDDATHMAAGLAYYAVLSLFPLAIGLISLLGLLLESEELNQEIYGFFETFLPVSERLLSANVADNGNIRGFLGVVGFLGLFWSASLMFGAITRSVNRAWDIHQDRPFYIDKVRNLAMAFSVAPLFLLSVSTTAALQMLEGDEASVGFAKVFLQHGIAETLSRILPFLFSLTIFLLIYKFTPNTRTYWRYIWPGALLAAVLFEVFKSVFVFYVDNFANYEEVYGSLASLIVLLAWTYFSGLILIAGAEFSSEYERMRYGFERGQVVGQVGRGASSSNSPTGRTGPKPAGGITGPEHGHSEEGDAESSSRD